MVQQGGQHPGFRPQPRRDHSGCGRLLWGHLLEAGRCRRKLADGPLPQPEAGGAATTTVNLPCRGRISSLLLSPLSNAGRRRPSMQLHE